MSVEILESPAVTAENPFPGLRPFEAEESDRFFGREGDVSELLARLRHMRFLAVVGTSGCGKSSLIRAGLIAALTDGALPGDWRIAILRPWQSPISQLAAALSGGGALDVPAGAPEETAAVVKAILRKGSLGIIETLQRYPLPPGDNLLILVDQFEELFTFMDDPKIKGAQDEARAFIKLLLEVICPKYKGLPVYVALTMRSDFLGNCALFPGLADAINNGLYLLPQMEREQLRAAIKGPVEAGGGKISERLIDTLINDLRDDADQLPILQHAMMRLWGQWRQDGGEKIDFEHYRKIGELSASLCKHAEEVFTNLDERQKFIAEAIFRSITRVKDGKVVRRQTKLGLIRKSPRLRDAGFKEVEEVVNEFRGDGRSFLVPPVEQKLDDETAVDISHESLIRQWGSLRKWAEQEAADREIYRQISDQASLWSRRGSDESYLFRRTRLIEANEWLKNNPDVLNETENDFIIASQNAYEKELLEQPKKELSEKVIAEGATQVASIRKGSAHVFLAYARKERPFAERLREAFRGVGEETLVDWDILPTVHFEDHMRAAIEAADTLVFVISPSSVESSLCVQELQYAASQNKRIVPVVARKVEEWRLPEQLRKEHWIRFDDKEGFDASFHMLREAIKSDLAWVQAHTRLLVRATEWDMRGHDASQLLRGRELSEAERWLAKEKLEPALTALQKQYIIASRANATKRQRWLFSVAAAGALVMLALLVVASAFGYAAHAQMRKAQDKGNEANLQRQEAEKQKALADEQRGAAERAAEVAKEQQAEADKARNATVAALQQVDSQRIKAEKARQAELVANRQLMKKNLKLRKQNLGLNELSSATEKIAGEVFASKRYDDLTIIENLGKMSLGYGKLGYEATAKAIYSLLVEETSATLEPEKTAGLLERLAKEFDNSGRRAEAEGLRKRARELLAKKGKPESKK